jgi:flagellar biosynthesis protein FliP
VTNRLLRLGFLGIGCAGLLRAAPGTSDPLPPLGQPLQIALLLGALSLLPAIIMSVTPFLRITLVLHFLRQALGTQTAPSNQALLGLALFLTAVVTQPLTQQLHDQSWAPYRAGTKTAEQAAVDAAAPVRAFLLKFAREKDIALILEISKTKPPKNSGALDLRVLVPAYMLSELRAGFQIGAVLFFPFLVIDLIVASVTLAVGMVQLPPAMLSAPFKILLFVLVDGWNLVVGSLVRSFG